MEKNQSEKKAAESFLVTSRDRVGIMARKKITIIGVGLIGGSLALQLHEKKISSRLIGVESSKSHAQEALELELVDEVLLLEDAIPQSDVIILATPVDAMVLLLPEVLNKVDNQI